MGPMKDMICPMVWVLLKTCLIHITFISNLTRAGGNNKGGFMALFYLPKLALDRGLGTLQVIGDSLLIINWKTEQLHVQNIGLPSIVE